MYCAEINPNGNIPKSLIKFSADLQGKIVSNLKNYMINKRQKKGGKIFDFDKGEGLLVGKAIALKKEALGIKTEEVKQEEVKENIY